MYKTTKTRNHQKNRYQDFHFAIISIKKTQQFSFDTILNVSLEIKKLFIEYILFKTSCIIICIHTQACSLPKHNEPEQQALLFILYKNQKF